MSTEPARIVRVTGHGADLFALDETDALWSYERRQYEMLWIQLPPLDDAIIDMYTHIRIDAWDSVRSALRVLDEKGMLWELRWVSLGMYLWDPVLEAR